MDRLQRLFAGAAGHGAAGPPSSDSPQVDTSEQIYISSLALLKMLKHGTNCITPFTYSAPSVSELFYAF
jgi:hypothetical protein